MSFNLNSILQRLEAHENRAQHSLNFTPSENVLSPLARIPFILDAYSRYFFDHKNSFGEWMFFGGIEAGEIQLNHTVPLLMELSGARFVDVRPLSGLNCMAIVMAGLCTAGELMYTIPEEWGGHMSTPQVARRFGIQTKQVKMNNHQIDLDSLAYSLKKDRPALFYIDQSTQLFPIDPKPIRDLIDHYSPDTILYYDSSHINGLILGGALPNPLENGAHIFGGSTHKSLPGPHKAFIATNSQSLKEKIDPIAYHMISHHQPAAVISLGICLQELRDCGGGEYARQILRNAKRFARGLASKGVRVAAADLGYTNCHQVWVQPAGELTCNEVAECLYKNGLLVNKLPGLPALDGPAFRISLAEVTRFGAADAEIDELVDLFHVFLTEKPPTVQENALRMRVLALKRRLALPRYCYSGEDLRDLGVPERFIGLLEAMELGSREDSRLELIGSVKDLNKGKETVWKQQS